MRTLFIILIIFTLSWQGVANARTLPAKCPMESTMMSMDNSETLADCCDVTSKGKMNHCKMMSVCSISIAYINSVNLQAVHLPQTVEPHATLSIFPSLLNPSNIWRPPNFV